MGLRSAIQSHIAPEMIEDQGGDSRKDDDESGSPVNQECDGSIEDKAGYHRETQAQTYRNIKDDTSQPNHVRE